MKFFAALSPKESARTPRYFFLHPLERGQEAQPQEQEPSFLRARRVKKRASAAARTTTAATITVGKLLCNHAIFYNTPPKSKTIRRTSAATIQATAHWSRTTRAAQRTPSSRRMAPIAATQGV